MTNEKITIKRKVFLLTLCLWDSPMGEIVGHHLFEGYPDIADGLLNDGWLSSCGVLHHRIHSSRDYFVTVTWDEERQQYGYSDDEYNWHVIPARDITRYVVDEKRFLKSLQSLLSIDRYYRLTSMADAACWYLGVAHTHPYRVHVYVVKQLYIPEVRQTLKKTLQNEVGHVPALILHSGAPMDDADMGLPLDRLLMPLEQLLTRTDQRCQIHKPTLNALVRRLHCDVSPEEVHKAKNLHFSDDYRQVCWYGESYKLTKKQAAAIEALHQEGGRAHKDFLCAAANTDAPLRHIFRNKVDGRYMAHPLWQTLIRSDGDGYYILSVSTPPIKS